MTDSGPSGEGPPDDRVRSPWPLLAGIGLVVVIIDQITKWWAVEELDGGRRIELFWTAQFRLVRNDGAAFSLGSGLTPLISIAAMAISIAVIVAARRLADQPRVVAALGLVLGGAVGNLIDRFFRPGDGFLAGHVIDFIDFQWYPVFNVADIGVVCGGILVVLLLRHSMPGGEEPEPHPVEH
ncbi:MAG: signal peptidase II [Actinomycetota bacterium]